MKRQKMRTEQKSNVKNSVGRLVFVGLSLLLQVLWILLLFLRLNAYSTAISLCFSVGAFLVALSIYAKHENAAFKMPWIILILAFPVLGLCIYLVFGHKNVVAKAMRRRFETIEPVLFEQIPQDEAVLGRLEEQDFAVANQCRYIKRFGHYPVYRCDILPGCGGGTCGAATRSRVGRTFYLYGISRDRGSGGVRQD